MKTIFTLILAAGSISFASAQSNNQRNSSFGNNGRDVKPISMPVSQQPAFGNDRSHSFDMNSFSERDKKAMIQRINREYDQKIAAVKWNRYMRSFEKTRQIRMLEMQRNQELRQVQIRFEQSNRRDRGHNW